MHVFDKICRGLALGVGLLLAGLGTLLLMVGWGIAGPIFQTWDRPARRRRRGLLRSRR